MGTPITLSYLLYAHEPGGWSTAKAQLEGFLAAYASCDPGIEHELVVIFNGFAERDADRLSDALRRVPHRSVRFAEDQQDLAAYVRVARDTRAPVVAFLNSHSRPLADAWLAALHGAAIVPDVGVAGATGSYESFRDAARGVPPMTAWQRARHAAWRIARHRDYRRAVAEFPPFPNPHIRTNAFAARRDVIVQLRIARLADKIDARALEAGHTSISRQLAAQGLRSVVVGRDGSVHEPPDWPASRTFRSGRQENLLVADNRTEQYQRAGTRERRRLAVLAWGGAADDLC